MAQHTDIVDQAKIEPVSLTCRSGPGVVLSVLAMIATAAIGHADTYQFSTPPGATMNGLPVDATAVFKTNDGSLLITIANNETNLKADDQVVVDVTFQIQQDGSLVDLALASETSRAVDIM